MTGNIKNKRQLRDTTYALHCLVPLQKEAYMPVYENVHDPESRMHPRRIVYNGKCYCFSDTGEVICPDAERVAKELMNRGLHKRSNGQSLEHASWIANECILSPWTSFYEFHKFFEQIHETSPVAYLYNPDAVILLTSDPDAGDHNLIVTFHEMSGLPDMDHCSIEELWDCVRNKFLIKQKGEQNV